MALCRRTGAVLDAGQEALPLCCPHCITSAAEKLGVHA